MGTDVLNKIYEDLEFLKKELVELKEHIADVDTVLTEDDIESLEEAEKDLKEGKTKRL